MRSISDRCFSSRASVSPGFMVLAPLGAAACPVVVGLARAAVLLACGRAGSAWTTDVTRPDCAKVSAGAEIQINAPRRAARPAAAICHSSSRCTLSASDRMWRFRGLRHILPTLWRRGYSIGLFHQDFALAGMVGLADHTFQFHPLHECRRPVVADLQPALDVAGGSLAVAGHDLHRLLVEIGAIARAH